MINRILLLFFLLAARSGFSQDTIFVGKSSFDVACQAEQVLSVDPESFVFIFDSGSPEPVAVSSAMKSAFAHLQRKSQYVLIECSSSALVLLEPMVKLTSGPKVRATAVTGDEDAYLLVPSQQFKSLLKKF